jgi:hypothetical protein
MERVKSSTAYPLQRQLERPSGGGRNKKVPGEAGDQSTAST